MQDLVRSYKQFSTSYYIRDGLRITLAIMLPIITFSGLGEVRMGVTTALGVLCVSLSDSPGPFHHRVNGMLTSATLVSMVALITGFSVHFHWLTAVELLVFSFIFSMIGIYGARATSIGIGGMLIMILHIDDEYTIRMVLLNTAFILMGGVWYFLLSLTLNRLQPYKLAQQAIGDAILSTAKYMHLRAMMYNKDTVYEENYRSMIDRQIILHAKQDLVREILFKTRSIVKDTTYKGRTLLAVFKDSVDLFEQIMSSHGNYEMLHEKIDEELLLTVEQTINKVATELEFIGIAMQAGNKSIPDPATSTAISELEMYFNNYRRKYINDTNAEALSGLRQIIQNLKSIYDRILIMHRYTVYDPRFTATVDPEVDRNKFISATEINVESFFSNLNLQSNIFRYSVRVSITLFLGYLLLRFLPFGHNYWILLTILVILKPAYSLTKKRNIERLTGTLIGIITGAFILYIIKNDKILLGIMIIAMIGAYSFLRIKYFLFVVLLTIYLLISFYLLKTDDFNKLIMERIVDTVIGSGLAFLATFLIPPKWEKEQIVSLIKNCVSANALYFKYVSYVFVNQTIDNIHYKLLRKTAYVSLANLSDAFQRMLSEPENKRLKGPEIYNMVVNNHLLLSHISSLA
ncbi:MAG TPA: FUSC family membrane protein, partial [Chitinophagales bacterium]|nr:FUSC family membrane protein [Chitinophagales bacterium]